MTEDLKNQTSSFLIDTGVKCACGECDENIWRDPAKTMGVQLYVNKKHAQAYYNRKQKKTKQEEPRICACGCKMPIPETNAGGRKKYVDDLHRNHHMMKKNNKLVKAKYMNQTREFNKTQVMRDAWKTNSTAMAKKFWDLFGAFGSCSVCGCTFEDNMDTHNVPLHAFLQPGINNYYVLNKNSYLLYCTDCYINIIIMKNDEYLDKFDSVLNKPTGKDDPDLYEDEAGVNEPDFYDDPDDPE